MLDRDGSGTLEVKEIVYAFGTLGFAISKDAIEEMMSEADRDGSGVMELDEFMNLMGRAIYRPDEHGKELVTATKAGDLSFADVVRAFRRKKLIESLIQGGDARLKVVEFHEKVQELIRAETEELRQRQATHAIFERLETARQEKQGKERERDKAQRGDTEAQVDASHRAKRMKAKLQDAIGKSLGAFEALYRKQNSALATPRHPDAPGSSGGGASAQDGAPWHGTDSGDGTPPGDGAGDGAVGSTVGGGIEGISARPSDAGSLGELSVSLGGGEGSGGGGRSSTLPRHLSVNPRACRVNVTFSADGAPPSSSPSPTQRGGSRLSPGDHGRGLSPGRSTSPTYMDSPATTRSTQRVSVAVLKYFRQLEELAKQQERKYDDSARLNANFVAAKPDRSDFKQALLPPRPCSRVVTATAPSVSNSSTSVLGPATPPSASASTSALFTPASDAGAGTPGSSGSAPQRQRTWAAAQQPATPTRGSRPGRQANATVARQPPGGRRDDSPPAASHASHSAPVPRLNDPWVTHTNHGSVDAPSTPSVSSSQPLTPTQTARRPGAAPGRGSPSPLSGGSTSQPVPIQGGSVGWQQQRPGTPSLPSAAGGMRKGTGSGDGAHGNVSVSPGSSASEWVSLPGVGASGASSSESWGVWPTLGLQRAHSHLGPRRGDSSGALGLDAAGSAGLADDADALPPVARAATSLGLSGGAAASAPHSRMLPLVNSSRPGTPTLLVAAAAADARREAPAPPTHGSPSPQGVGATPTPSERSFVGRTQHGVRAGGGIAVRSLHAPGPITRAWAAQCRSLKDSLHGRLNAATHAGPASSSSASALPSRADSGCSTLVSAASAPPGQAPSASVAPPAAAQQRAAPAGGGTGGGGGAATAALGPLGRKPGGSPFSHGPFRPASRGPAALGSASGAAAAALIDGVVSVTHAPSPLGPGSAAAAAAGALAKNAGGAASGGGSGLSSSSKVDGSSAAEAGSSAAGVSAGGARVGIAAASPVVPLEPANKDAAAPAEAARSGAAANAAAAADLDPGLTAEPSFGPGPVTTAADDSNNPTPLSSRPTTAPDADVSAAATVFSVAGAGGVDSAATTVSGGSAAAVSVSGGHIPPGPLADARWPSAVYRPPSGSLAACASADFSSQPSVSNSTPNTLSGQLSIMARLPSPTMSIPTARSPTPPSTAVAATRAAPRTSGTAGSTPVATPRANAPPARTSPPPAPIKPTATKPAATDPVGVSPFATAANAAAAVTSAAATSPRAGDAGISPAASLAAASSSAVSSVTPSASSLLAAAGPTPAVVSPVPAVRDRSARKYTAYAPRGAYMSLTMAQAQTQGGRRKAGGGAAAGMPAAKAAGGSGGAAVLPPGQRTASPEKIVVTFFGQQLPGSEAGIVWQPGQRPEQRCPKRSRKKQKDAALSGGGDSPSGEPFPSLQAATDAVEAPPPPSSSSTPRPAAATAAAASAWLSSAAAAAPAGGAQPPQQPSIATPVSAITASWSLDPLGSLDLDLDHFLGLGPTGHTSVAVTAGAGGGGGSGTSGGASPRRTGGDAAAAAGAGSDRSHREPQQQQQQQQQPQHAQQQPQQRSPRGVEAARGAARSVSEEEGYARRMAAAAAAALPGALQGLAHARALEAVARGPLGPWEAPRAAPGSPGLAARASLAAAGE